MSFQGLIAHVDLTEKKVVEIEDHGVVKVPEAHARYDKDGLSDIKIPLIQQRLIMFIL